MAEGKASAVWVPFSTSISAVWLADGFHSVPTRNGLRFRRKLSETSQLVHYDIGERTNDLAMFTIELAVWSRRLLKLRPESTTREGHWFHNLLNLMPPESGHLWWTVTADDFDADMSLHAELAHATILPVLDSLATDVDLIRAWTSGGRLAGLAGLDPIAERSTNAVLLAEAIGGRDLAETVARDLTTIAYRSSRDRAAHVAHVRRLLENLPVDATFIEADSKGDAN